jgi:2-polyprenyl-3-methyl-5-hydroxy-6-metoxy-1,4-benzoquinol methylase
MTHNVTENMECLACGSKHLFPSLTLGKQPLANNFISEKIDLPVYPLGVNVCNNCYHVQLTHTVDPKIIYSNYLYVAGTSQTLKDYSKWFAGYVSERLTGLSYNVLDIGCNDGTQLDCFTKHNMKTYGVDPAENIYATSSENHNVICDFFGPNIVNKLPKVKFDAITAQNVFAHNPNPLEFLQTCTQLMDDHTQLFIQTSQADMILNNEFDTIYHEHINFFNVNSMNELAKRANLNLIDVIKTPIHGNSYVFVFSKLIKREYHISNIIKSESKLLNIKTYDDWKENTIKNMSTLKITMNDFKANGYVIVGYGAAAKGNTLLNYIDTPLDLIIDDSPLKQNLYAPGTNSPIKSIDALKELSKDTKILFMPLAWNFFTEISKRIKAVRNEPQDKFLKYFPNVEVV